MYNKFLNCLNDMGYGYRECERVHFETNITAFNVVEVHDFSKVVYFEFAEGGDVYTWSSDGELLSITIKDKDYIMLFRLGWILQRM